MGLLLFLDLKEMLIVKEHRSLPIRIKGLVEVSSKRSEPFSIQHGIQASVAFGVKSARYDEHNPNFTLRDRVMY